MKLESKIENFAHEGGFTLIEMLLVVAIIGIIVSIAVPAMSTAKADAQTQKEKALITAIETAKTRAVLAGGLPDNPSLSLPPLSTFVNYSHISSYLVVNGETAPTRERIVMGSQNGTGKNITNWRRVRWINRSENLQIEASPVQFGTGTPVTN